MPQQGAAHQGTERPLKFSEILKKFPGILGNWPVSIGVALAFVISVICDLIYFGALNISLAQAPLTLGYHIRSSVFWGSPVFLCAVIFLFILPRLLKPFEKYGKDKKSWYDVNWDIVLRPLPYLLLAWFFSLLIFYLIIYAGFTQNLENNIRIICQILSALGLGNGIAAIITIIILLITKSTRTYSVFVASAWQFLVFCAVFLISVHFYANNSANCEIREKYEIRTNQAKRPNTVLVRNFDNYLLIRDCETKNLIFLNSNNVRSIIRPAEEN